MSKKGIKQTPEHRKKISEALKGHPMYKSQSRKDNLSKALSGKYYSARYTLERNKKISKAFTGRKLSEETRKKLSESHKGKKQTPEAIEKRAAGHRGRKNTPETRLKMSLAQKRGALSRHWKGGVTTINEAIRKSVEYKLWREAVFKRDNYTCVWCLIRGGKLNADHIKPFALYPELRFSIDNGRTLCEPCHRATDTYGIKTKKII